MKRKRSISFILVSFLILGCLWYVKPISVSAATNHTQSEAIAWASARGTERWNRDVDGYAGCQCVDLIMAYYDYLVGYHVSGNAKDYNTNSLPAGWTRVNSNPQAGDVIVWGPGALLADGNYRADSTYGHVGIITSVVNGSKVNTVETNTYEGGSAAAHFQRYSTTALCFIRPNWNNNKDPLGAFDLCSGGTGTIRLAGWAFDPDTPSASISVHVYIGGPAGTQNTEFHAFNADGPSSDVNNAYGISGKHRFDVTIPVQKSGSQPVYLYAINTSAGNNPNFGTKTAVITKDNEKPVITNPKVTNLDSTGYTVTCTVTDNVAVKEISFPTWSDANGQDDIVWYKGVISGNTASVRVQASNHGVGKLNTHIYAYDVAGNTSVCASSYDWYPGRYIIVPCSTHRGLVTDVGKQATCTASGLTDGSHCTVCGAVVSEQKEIPAKGHSVVIDKAVPATTSTTGLTEGSHCSVCGITIKKQEVIPKLTEKDKGSTNNNGGTKDNSSSDSNKNNSNPKYSNEWVNGKWYNIDGVCDYAGTLSWKSNAKGWWIEDSEGWYPTNQWQKIDGIWYFFKPDGYMASNEYYNGYWFNRDGSWDSQYKLSWKSNSKGWWVEDISGWWPSSTWLKIDGYWYYFNASGYMVTNQYVDGWWIGADGVCY